jgi:hypothetical protein
MAGPALAGAAGAAPAEPVAPQSLEVQAELATSSQSPAEARANLAIQDQAARVDLVGQLEDELDQSYAGVWFDNEAGEFVVPVATAGDGGAAAESGERAAEGEFASASLSGDFRTDVVRYSSVELEAAQDGLNERLAPFFEQAAVQTAVDPEANALEVRIPKGMAPTSQAEVEALAQGVQVPVEVVQLDPQAFEVTPSGCDEARRLCDLPVRGGEAMYGGPAWPGPHGEELEEICSVGFRANGFDGRKYILTAGHCAKRNADPNGETNWSWKTTSVSPQDNHYIGVTAQWHFPGKDWAKIDATGTWADTPPWPTELAYWGSTFEYPVVGEARAYKGETLCHVGMNTGTSCGIVRAENVSVTYNAGPVAQMNGMFEVVGSGLALGGGDSGGPVVANNIALGLTSGGISAYNNATLYFNDITEATAELNVNIAGPGIAEVITGAPLSVGQHEATVSGQVDPHGLQTEYAVEYGIGGLSNLTFWDNVGSGQGFVPLSKAITDLEPATTYQYRLTATNGFGTANGTVGSFRTAPVAPAVTTVGAEAVKKNTATLVGKVNPIGEPTSYQFEYGTTTAYGSVVPLTAEGVGAGRTAVTVRQAIAGLSIGTTYHFRIRATNAGGTSYGSDQTFKTPDKPVITAEAASYVNTLEPRMNATINPERAETQFQFEYGTTEAYGTKVTAETIGSGPVATVGRGLKGLQRNTTYHYRVTAENEVGVVYGADRSFTTLPPCKGAEAKCTWSLQEASDPVPPSKFEMKSVSCASPTLCVAVGKDLYNGRSFIDRWNGTSWSLVSSSVAGEMKHVTCLGAGCIAVGVSGGVAATWSVAEYPVGQGSWAVISLPTPLPAGSSETVLRGVSCSGGSGCTAVGSYKGPEGTYHPLVERWNGSAWSLQSAPNPAEGSAQNAMLSVSCMSYGCFTVGEAAGKPVAATWVSGTWALSTPKLPAGAKGGRLSSISCTPSSCIAVGESNEGLGTEKALAESMEGLSWSLMSAPTPAGAKGFVELAGVSCASASGCTAAGYYAPAVGGGVPTELKTLAEAWNGSSWTIQSSPNVAGQKFNALADVSCSAGGACTAVGQDATAAVGASPEALAERWNGSSWSTQAVVNPIEPIEDELKSVSCPSNTLCVGVGKDLLVEDAFVGVWNGTGWHVAATVAGEVKKVSCASSESCTAVGASGGSAKVWLLIRSGSAWAVQGMTIPLPAGSTESIVAGVSCLPGGSPCTAVGSYKGPEGTYHPLVERSNGSTWSLQSAPNPAEGSAQNAMLSVSCAGPSTCMAVGEAAGKPFAELWTAGSWVPFPTPPLTAPPLPAGAKGGTFAAVSCGSTTSCMAVGNSNEGSGSEKALAERWNGANWTIVGGPSPAGAKGFVNLNDVACLSPNACFSAGSYATEVSGGVPVSLKSLFESWDGTGWSVLATPNLAGQAFNSLAGISCSTSIDCTAVGGATSSLTKRPPVQLVMRFE